MLAELEAAGDAMRYEIPMVELHGRQRRRLRNFLMDLQLDAETDLEDV